MNAELSRLLARAVQSVYFSYFFGKYLEEFDVTVMSDELPQEVFQEWLTEQAIAAYSLDKLDAPVQEFLQKCDRSWQIEQELFAGKEAGEWDDAKVLERLEEEGVVKLEQEQEAEEVANNG